MHLWDVEAAKEKENFAPGIGTMVYTYVSPDKRFIASACPGLSIIDVQQKKLVKQLSGEMIERAAFSPDSKLLCAAMGTGELVVWRAETGEEVKRIDLGENDVGGIWCAWSHDGRWVAATDGLARVHIYDARTWKEARVIELAKAEEFESYLVSFTKDGKHLVAISISGTCKLYGMK